MNPSFRDPGGRLTVAEDGVFRSVFGSGIENWRAFQQSKTVERLQRMGQMVGSKVISENDTQIILQHDRIPFVSYVHEWPPEMLHAAACLTLNLAADLAKEGLGLKDATPHNVLFQGPLPTFVDVLSVERRTADDPIWAASAQFVRTFLLPLVLNQRLGLPVGQVFLARRDGLEPEAAAEALPFYARLLPPFLQLVTLPRLLSRWTPDSVYEAKRAMSADAARFILGSHFKRLGRLLRRFAPSPTGSRWSSYADSCPSYTKDQRDAKRTFVTRAFHTMQTGSVLDVGANDGEYSIMACRHGAAVVAIDSDPAVCGRLFVEARQRKLDILPLVVDFARPSPAVGWRNAEQQAFLTRAAKRFDGVLMLAVLHHLLVREQLPLEQILTVVSQLTRRWLLIEYVDPSDAMFRRLVRGRAALYDWLTPKKFVELAADAGFRIVEEQAIPDSGRSLYLMALEERAG